MFKYLIEWVIVGVAFLLVSHAFMVGLASITVWENYFVVWFGEWERFPRFIYFAVQSYILCCSIKSCYQQMNEL